MVLHDTTDNYRRPSPQMVLQTPCYVTRTWFRVSRKEHAGPHGVTWCHMTLQTSLPDPVYPVTSLAHGFEFRAFRAEGLVHLGLGA